MLDKGGLDKITTFGSLIEYLRDQLDWPIEEMTFDDLTYEWDPKEFGLKADEIAGQVEIKQLRPIEREPWGIFFLSLPHRKIPVTVLRRILGHLAVRKRASANAGNRAAWDKGDLLFIAAHGEGSNRGLAFAHFHEDKAHGDLPTLNVLGWDGADTIRRLSATHETLQKQLHWRDSGESDNAWRARWNGAFREKPGEAVATSKAMAKELARLAREIRRRANELLAEENDQGPLRKLHAAFKEALIHDLKFDDFADMYAQTIAYGLLSARISRESGALVADNAADLAPPTNPFLKELLETFLKAGGRKGGMDFDELGVNDVVEMLRRANMEAVLRDFDDRNPNEDPVIHFYELFLKEYDAQKRMQRGVFYTPRPVVSFIVRSVDEVLRTEFRLEDGLASTATWGEVIAASKNGDGPEIVLPEGAQESDPFVRVLDPATGTGTFLVEAIDLIHAKMTAKWKKAGKREGDIAALWNEYVPKHLLPRLYGFELMMAPYAIAHMKLGLKLYETGYRFGSEERARIYLTNALEPAQAFDMQLAFMSEALAHEAKAANAAKEVRFTVVVGNPPYSVSSSNRGAWIERLMQDFKRNLEGERNLQPLSDDYLKFFRLAFHHIELSGVGVTGFVTNREFHPGALHRAFRSYLSEAFSSAVFTDLGGQAGVPYQGKDDENLFDIRKGVAISVVTLGGKRGSFAYRRLSGTRAAKADQLLGSNALPDAEVVRPVEPQFLFVPRSTSLDSEYDEFVPLPGWFQSLPTTGFATHRDHFAIAFSKVELDQRIRSFADVSLSDEQVRAEFDLPDTRDWKLGRARRRVAADAEAADRSTPFSYRPFDVRWVYYSDDILEYSRRSTMNHVAPDRLALLASRIAKDEAFAHVFVSSKPVEKIFLSAKSSNNAQVFLSATRRTDAPSSSHPNFATAILAKVGRLSGLGWDDCVDASLRGERGDLSVTFGPRDVFDWIYAVLHAPGYRARYADYLKGAFARVPLPGSRELFQALVPLGTQLVALHLLNADAAPELKDPQAVRFAGHGEARVEQAPQWSAASGGRVTISDHRWFEGVPERVWNFHIGGYQPAQKWLKDRAKKGGKKASPGRLLTAEDQLHYRRMIAAMDRTIDLMAEIDRVIDQHGGWPEAFKGINNERETD